MNERLHPQTCAYSFQQCRKNHFQYFCYASTWGVYTCLQGESDEGRLLAVIPLMTIQDDHNRGHIRQ